MRRAYNELKSIVVTPVAPMHPYTCVPLHVYTCVGGTHDTIWAYDDREIGRSMITDGGERRTEVTRGGGEGGRLLRKSRGATEGWRDGGGWCRKSEGNVSSLASPLFLSLSLSLPLPVSTKKRDRDGSWWEEKPHQVDLGWTTIEVVLPSSEVFAFADLYRIGTCPLPIKRDWIRERRSEASLNGTLLGGRDLIVARVQQVSLHGWTGERATSRHVT